MKLKILIPILLLCCSIAILFLFPILETGFSLKEMDWNNNGMTSFSEMYYALDVKRNEFDINQVKCYEYISLKDGLPFKLVCENGNVFNGSNEIARSHVI